jgi:hypothetical protein
MCKLSICLYYLEKSLFRCFTLSNGVSCLCYSIVRFLYTVCVSQHYVTVTEGERFVPAHCFRGFSPCSVGCTVFRLWLGRTSWLGQWWSRATHLMRRKGVPASPSRAHLQWPSFSRFNYFPTAPLAGDQAFNTGAFGGHLRSKPWCPWHKSLIRYMTFKDFLPSCKSSYFLNGVLWIIKCFNFHEI